MERGGSCTKHEAVCAAGAALSPRRDFSQTGIQAGISSCNSSKAAWGLSAKGAIEDSKVEPPAWPSCSRSRQVRLGLPLPSRAQSQNPPKVIPAFP